MMQKYLILMGFLCICWAEEEHLCKEKYYYQRLLSCLEEIKKVNVTFFESMAIVHEHLAQLQLRQRSNERQQEMQEAEIRSHLSVNVATIKMKNDLIEQLEVKLKKYMDLIRWYKEAISQHMENINQREEEIRYMAVEIH